MAKKNTYYQEDTVKNKFNGKALKRILRYALPHKKTFLLILSLMLGTVAISLLPPLLLRAFINDIQPNQNRTGFILFIGAFVGIGVCDVLFNFFTQRLSAKTGHTIIHTLRAEIFERLQKLPFDYFDSLPTGKIVVRVTNYVDDLANFFANLLLNFIIAVTRIVVVIVFMLVLNPLLTAVVAGAMIPLAAFVVVLRKLMAKHWRKMRAYDSGRAAFLHENIMGVNVIKSFNREEQNIEIYAGLQNDCAKNWRKIVRRNELFTPGVEFIWNAGYLGIFAVALWLVTQGQIDAGTIVAFTNYLGMFTWPINNLAMIFQQLAQVSSNLERIFSTMDADEVISEPEHPKTAEIEGNIEYRDVTFGYEPGIPILEHFDLSVKAGQCIALVGPTGAGKTTVVNLLTRFYDVTEGAVCVDGLDVREMPLHFLRSNVGVMMQDSFLFKGNIIENIRYGRPDATDAECIQAAKTIFADEFINRLPQGYYTPVAENGDGLSSGEKQLLSFARVILKSPRVLILDEATSAIDTETEERIQRALKVVLENRTSFVIAHRLSTIQSADRILYIANHGIAESGTHEELIKKRGLYYELTQQA